MRMILSFVGLGIFCDYWCACVCICVCTNEGQWIDAKELWSLSVINRSQKRSRFDKGEENKILVCYFSSISIKTQICIYIKAIVYRLDKCYCWCCSLSHSLSLSLSHSRSFNQKLLERDNDKNLIFFSFFTPNLLRFPEPLLPRLAQRLQQRQLPPQPWPPRRQLQRRQLPPQP